MKHIPRLSTFSPILLALLIGCAPQQIQDNTDEDRAAIDASNAIWGSAISNGDAAGIASRYTEDAQLMPPNSPAINGRTAIQDFFQGLLDAGLTVGLETTEVRSGGDIAWEIGTAQIMTTAGQVVDEAKYIVVWTKVDGDWLMHRDIFNSNWPVPQADGAETDDG
jgi:uncharacterized protein (TIGR02246 family)